MSHQTTEVEKRFWFTKRSNNSPVDLKTDSDYTDRVEYFFHNDDCTLRIRDLRERDSAEYKFRFITNHGGFTGSPGVTLSVTDLQVQVTRPWTQGELRCHSSCNVPDNPSYVWFNNGQKMDGETSSSLRVSVEDNNRYYNNYSCAVTGYEDYRSPPVYGPKLPSVSVSPSAEIVEGSSVTLTCSSDANPGANYTWYKENVDKPLSKGPQLVFSSIRSSDSGQYYCAAENELGTKTSQYKSIDVKYAPKVVLLSLTPTGEIRENSRVTLTCSSDANPAATYTWYKNGKPLNKNTQIVFSSIQSSDSGQYYCEAENKLGRRRSRSIFIDVKYAPKLPSVSVSPSAEIVEGSSVTLTCSSDANPAATYTWYKENVKLRPPIEEQQLVLTSIQSSHSGQYTCRARNSLGPNTSKPISIKVKYGPKLPSVSVSPSGEIEEGSSVTLTCQSKAYPAANYTWYKKNRNPELQPLSENKRLVFSSIQSSDSGQYYCTAENELGRRTSRSISIDVKYGPKLPSVSVSPSAEIVEGSSVNLTCSSDANPAANYTWYKENEDSPKASGQIFTITDFRAEHSGNYYCEAQNRRGSQNSTLHLM
ncbi:B-cell receptor CD22 [Perca flavescens]|uniref:B-cell receptor CD22 n=1 Tax=Perca flavescens TaxID=8167 RepID=UPI00106DD3C5|nr:B-cell receptor CD22-like [Perca flavescens]